MIDLSKYHKTIKALTPLTSSAFIYNKKTWEKLNPDFARCVSDFEDRPVSRQDIINVYCDYFSKEKDWERPFLLTMIWGFGDAGYGTYRTNMYLAGEKNSKLIKDAFDAVSNLEIEKAYKILNSITGLSISYISKILYFATRACNYIDYSLIFDIRVARALIKMTTIPEIFEIVEITPSSKFKHYQIYNLLIHNYSKKINVEAESLEMFLFDFDAYSQPVKNLK